MSTEEKPKNTFLAFGLRLGEKEAVINLDTRPEGIAAPSLDVAVVVQGQKLTGTITFDDRGSTGSPAYVMVVKLGTAEFEVPFAPVAPIPVTKRSNLGPEYTIGPDGYPILKSALAKAAS